MNTNNFDLYCCYSLNLREFLSSKGIKYKLCALNPNSHKRFWVYVKTDELNTALNDWSAKK